MVYVMSDIHGNLRRFRSVLDQIQLQPEDSLYILGDVIDRHPDGIPILLRIMAMSNAKMLLGNHEYMMLRALGRPYDTYQKMDKDLIEDALRLWRVNGGEVTYRNWKQLQDNIRKDIIQYLHSLPVSYDIEVNGVQYKLAHGAPMEEYEYFRRFYPDPTYFAVWKNWRIFDEQHGDYTFVFGHNTTNMYQKNLPLEIFELPDRIGIDCGSGFPEGPVPCGRLACLRLDDRKVFYSEEKIT